MARKALVVKCAKANNKALHTRKLGKKVKFSTRLYHRCEICGRPRWYIGRFWMCRICIREKANAWELMWLRKSSW